MYITPARAPSQRLGLPEDADDPTLYFDKLIDICADPDASKFWVYSDITFLREVPFVSVNNTAPFPYILDPRISYKQYCLFRPHHLMEAPSVTLIAPVLNDEEAFFETPVEGPRQLSLCEGFFIGPNHDHTPELYDDDPIRINDFLGYPALHTITRPNVANGGVFAAHLMGLDTGIAYSGLHTDFATTIASALCTQATLIQDRLKKGELTPSTAQTATVDILSLIATTRAMGVGDLLAWKHPNVQILKNSYPVGENFAVLFFPLESFVKQATGKRITSIPRSKATRIPVSFGQYMVPQGAQLVPGSPQALPPPDAKGNTEYAAVVIKNVTPAQWFSLFTCRQCDDIRFATRIRFYNIAPNENTTRQRNQQTWKWEEQRTHVKPRWQNLATALQAPDPFSFWQNLFLNVPIRKPRAPSSNPLFFYHSPHDPHNRPLALFNDDPSGVPVDALGAWFLFGQYLRYPIFFPPTLGVPYVRDNLEVCSSITVSLPNQPPVTMTPGLTLYNQTHFCFPTLTPDTDANAIKGSVDADLLNIFAPALDALIEAPDYVG